MGTLEMTTTKFGKNANDDGTLNTMQQAATMPSPWAITDLLEEEWDWENDFNYPGSKWHH